MSKHSGKTFCSIERKLYPTKTQAVILEQWRIECCRVYNRTLEQRIKAYKRRKQSVSLYDQQKLLTQQRKRIPSIQEIPVVFVRDALHRINKAFQAFFRRVRIKAKRKGFPRFKPCHRYRSMEYMAPGKYFLPETVYVPGLGEIASRGQSAIGPQNLLRLINHGEEWFAQVLVETHVPSVTIEPKTSVGIDVGLYSFATLSTGEKVENPRYFRRSERKLRRVQRNLSKKKKGSQNRIKARKRVAKLHMKIAAQRKSFCHQESRKLVNRFDLIGFENLNIAGLAKSKLAKSILDAAWGMFLRFIAYKASSAGKRSVGVDARQTSQECPWCGKIKKKKLSERIHQCECGCLLDRDEAAAQVIEARALAVAGVIGLPRNSPLPNGKCCSASGAVDAGSPNIAITQC